ncbi:NUDIX hydrolase [candidate division KSB1 bacterium]|nr:NUDIX hydrolase [candidate division KSB1 bacterium]
MGIGCTDDHSTLFHDWERDDGSGREYPRHPRLAVAVICFDRDRFLLIRRGQEPHKNCWSFPGGGVLLGESLHDAAKRELDQECRVECRILALVDIAQFIERDNTGRIRYHYVIADYLAEYKGGEVRAGSDSIDANWFKPDEVVNLSTTPGLEEMLQKALIRRKSLKNER